jgi:hypothetical protein
MTTSSYRLRFFQGSDGESGERGVAGPQVSNISTLRCLWAPFFQSCRLTELELR